MESYDLLIAGEHRPAASGEAMEVEDPHTGRSFATVARAGVEDVDAAVAGAHRAFEVGTWAQMPATQRGRHLHRVADGLRAGAEALATVLAREAGKPISSARWEV